MNRVVHFDIYADNPARASRFYSDVFGWKFDKWDGEGMDYWLISTGSNDEPGINGGMAKREGEWGKNFASYGAVTVNVSDIDDSIFKVEKAGGELVMKKGAIPGVGWFANFRDPEGNVLGLMQDDKEAK